MKKVIQNDELFEGKELILEEHPVTGNVTLSLDGKPLTKIGKKSFIVKLEEEEIKILYEGNRVSGTRLRIKDNTYPVWDKQPVYVWPLAFLPFLLIMIFSNIPYLAKNGFPVVGGAIGGGISGALCVLSFYTMTMTRKPLWKVLISLAFVIGTILICYLLGTVIIAMLS